MTTEKLGFHDADYYDCQDSEQLTYDEPRLAIEELVDCFLEPGCDVSAIIAKISPVTVVAWVKKPIDDKWLNGLARSILEQAFDWFADEFLDDAMWPTERIEEFTAETAKLLKRFLGAQSVYWCNQVGEKVFSAAEVEELMREHRPDWFEPTGQTQVT